MSARLLRRIDEQVLMVGNLTYAEYRRPAPQSFQQSTGHRLAPPLAVLTRTKNRPHLLSRALESLLAQTRTDFVWIVADDGESTDSSKEIIARAKARLPEVISFAVVNSAGMETATNQALAAATTQFVALLDDDDTWEPTFVSETLAFLSEFPGYAGVCTQTSIVQETNDQPPKKLKQYVMNPDLRSVTLADLALSNRWTSNAFVYRRDAHKKLGLYREDLRVLGDWEFNLRFLVQYDVGVLAKPLANYHWRMQLTDPGDPNANTVVASLDEHILTASRIRNELLREDFAAASVGLGFLLALGQMQSTAILEQRKQIESIERRLASSFVKSFIAYVARKFFDTTPGTSRT